MFLEMSQRRSPQIYLPFWFYLFKKISKCFFEFLFKIISMLLPAFHRNSLEIMIWKFAQKCLHRKIKKMYIHKQIFSNLIRYPYNYQKSLHIFTKRLIPGFFFLIKKHLEIYLFFIQGSETTPAKPQQFFLWIP